ncbi:amidohydrolase [Pseudomonas sp. PDM28]|uniref:amidohydrolase n=1 Tax=Pseudomonas sp. PDM28 TaxID=2854770 RepID=UPI001C48D51E|nr:amidohydrolase [Pseudomonas sp. PDM28]
MNFGEPDPESTHCFDQIVELAEGLDFVIVIHQEIAAPGAFLEKHDPFPQLRRILDHMGGRDKSLCMALPDLLSFHSRLQK